VVFILVGGITLTAYAPDEISMVFIILMELIIGAGVLIGIVPLIQYYRAFDTGMTNIDRAMEVQTNSTWTVSVQIEEFFHQKFMDQQFKEYQEKVQSQRASGLILSDINEYLSDDILGNKSWQNIMLQIPGMLTSLGILGTFLGLIVGIRGIGFSSVNAALTSVQSLLSGIQVAFYTSIAGVILSLIFNITYRIAWNMLVRNLGLFIDEFHKNVIPSVEEQIRYRERKEIKKIIELLERLPKSGQFSVAGGSAPTQAQNSSNEQILMPQILQGLRDGEFIFFLQPRFDLNSQKVIGAEALVRWKHGKLGMVSPAVFIPILESNGYITKLDQYIWEKVCTTIRHWIDSNIRPVPISINVTKTDVLAIDIVDFFNNMIKKYLIPPRYLEVEIAQNAYMQASNVVLETESKLRQSGFRVVMDGFNGDFIQLHSIPKVDADILKLDLRRLQGNVNQGSLNLIFEQARNMNMSLGAEGIENMEQMNMLRKCGCAEGQGFFLSKPISLEDFESVISEGEVKRSELPGQSGRPEDQIPIDETPEPENGGDVSQTEVQQTQSTSEPASLDVGGNDQPVPQAQNPQNPVVQTEMQAASTPDAGMMQEQHSASSNHDVGMSNQPTVSPTQYPQESRGQNQQAVPAFQGGTAGTI